MAVVTVLLLLGTIVLLLIIAGLLVIPCLIFVFSDLRAEWTNKRICREAKLLPPIKFQILDLYLVLIVLFSILAISHLLFTNTTAPQWSYFVSTAVASGLGFYTYLDAARFLTEPHKPAKKLLYLIGYSFFMHFFHIFGVVAWRAWKFNLYKQLRGETEHARYRAGSKQQGAESKPADTF